jgi:hypothetical protein
VNTKDCNKLKTEAENRKQIMPRIRQSRCVSAACIVAGLAFFATAPAAFAQVTFVTLPASADNTMYEPEFSFDQFASGAGENIFAGRTRQGKLRRALLRFDIASAVPAGATIESVQLRLTCNRNSGGLANYQLHALTRAWGEGTSDAGDPGGLGAPADIGDATWTHALYDTQLWTTPGGDFVAAPSLTLGIGPVGNYEFPSTPWAVADVQSWLNTPATNFGWLLKSEVETVAGARRFASREDIQVAERPALVVGYTVGNTCDTIDFNGDGLLPDTGDIDDFLSVFSGGPCSTGMCGDLDFNNDGLFPDTADIDALLSQFSGGPCL